MRTSVEGVHPHGVSSDPSSSLDLFLLEFIGSLLFRLPNVSSCSICFLALLRQVLSMENEGREMPWRPAHEDRGTVQWRSPEALPQSRRQGQRQQG